jgi:hypothetical protein
VNDFAKYSFVAVTIGHQIIKLLKAFKNILNMGEGQVIHLPLHPKLQ